MNHNPNCFIVKHNIKINTNSNYFKIALFKRSN